MTPTPSLPPDDLPSTQTNQSDAFLRRQLEDSVTRHFYESCDGVTQSLLMTCDWGLTTSSTALTLVINCPDMPTNWRVLNNIVPIANRLEKFAPTAKIRVCPPAELGSPYEIRVDEIAIYRDSM